MQDDAPYAEDRSAMVTFQIARRGVEDERVLDAMRKVPRHAFVPPEHRAHAYADRPLPIGSGQTISQPYIVARFVEAAQLKPGDRVLEVGGGSGYAAAVMSQIAQEVWAIERHGPLARHAQETLAEIGCDNVHLIHGDGTKGLPDQAPFDVVVVSAGGDLPEALKAQVAVGGRIVVPLPEGDWQVLTVLHRTGEETWEVERGEPVRFVPLIASVADDGGERA